MSAQEQPTVRVGSDDFYESKLMAEIYAQALEGAGFTVDRQLGLGSRDTRAPAFEEGQVDLVPEYVGSGLGYYVLASDDPGLAALAVSGDGETNRANLQAAYDAAGHRSHRAGHDARRGHQRGGRPGGHGRRARPREAE